MNIADETNKLANCINPTMYGQYVKFPCDICTSCKSLNTQFHREIKKLLDEKNKIQPKRKWCNCFG